MRCTGLVYSPASLGSQALVPRASTLNFVKCFGFVIVRKIVFFGAAAYSAGSRARNLVYLERACFRLEGTLEGPVVPRAWGDSRLQAAGTGGQDAAQPSLCLFAPCSFIRLHCVLQKIDWTRTFSQTSRRLATPVCMARGSKGRRDAYTFVRRAAKRSQGIHRDVLSQGVCGMWVWGCVTK